MAVAVVVVVEVVERIRNLVVCHAFVVENNTVAVEVPIPLKDHTVDFVSKHTVVMDVHLYSTQPLYHHNHNEHYCHTWVFAVGEVDHAWMLVVDVASLPFVVGMDLMAIVVVVVVAVESIEHWLDIDCSNEDL